MSTDVLSAKELQLTCNATLAVLDDVLNEITGNDEIAEQIDDVQGRLQRVVDALQRREQNDVRTCDKGGRYQVEVKVTQLVGATSLREAERKVHRILWESIEYKSEGARIETLNISGVSEAQGSEAQGSEAQGSEAQGSEAQKPRMTLGECEILRKFYDDPNYGSDAEIVSHAELKRGNN